MYGSVASSNVSKVSFFCSREWLSRNMSPKIPELTTSWCSIARTVWTNDYVDHRGFALQAAINCSCSSLLTTAVHSLKWRPFTTVWIWSYLSACCFWFLLLLALRMMFRCVSWVILLVAALAALWWTNLYLHPCCVPMSDLLDETPVSRLDSDPDSPGWGLFVCIIWWCGIEEEDDNDKKWEVLRDIQFASCQNGISSSQVVRYTQDESCCVWLQVSGIFRHPTIYNNSIWCCLFVSRDKLRCTTAEISWLSDMNRTFFEGKDVCWWSSQKIPGIIHETDINKHVMLYS